MAKLIDFNLENNYYNSDASALTLYFDGEPTEEEVKDACRATLGKQVIGVDPDKDDFSWDKCPTTVSERAGVVRVQCHPTC